MLCAERLEYLCGILVAGQSRQRVAACVLASSRQRVTACTLASAGSMQCLVGPLATGAACQGLEPSAAWHVGQQPAYHASILVSRLRAIGLVSG